MKKIFFAPLLALYILLFCQATPGQTFMLHNLPRETGNFSVTFQHPYFTGNSMSFFYGLYEATATVPLSQKYSIELSIPYLVATQEGFTNDGTGNFFIALQTHDSFKNNTGSSGTLGLFLPIASEDMTLFGGVANFLEYYKYLDKTITVYGNYAFRKRKPSGVLLTFEIGPVITIPIDDNNMDANLLLHYGGGLGVELNKFTLFSEVKGLMIINERITNFPDRFVHTIGLGAQYKAFNFRPGVFFHWYLKDNLSDLVDGVLGIKIEIGGD